MKQRLRWSWIGFAGAALAAGATITATVIWGIQHFRTGLDADMSVRMSEYGFADWAAIAGITAPFTLPILVIAWMVANRTSRPAVWFKRLVVVVPTGIFLAGRAYSIIQAAREPRLETMFPWDPDRVFYLPNWLEVVAIGASFAIAAAAYLKLSEWSDSTGRPRLP